MIRTLALPHSTIRPEGVFYFPGDCRKTLAVRGGTGSPLIRAIAHLLPVGEKDRIQACAARPELGVGLR